MNGRNAQSPHDEAAVAWCLRMSERALTASEQDALRVWLASDPECQDRLDAVVGLWEGIESDAHEPEMLVLRRQALESVEQAGRRRWPAERWWRQPWLAVAAMLLIAVGLTALLRDRTLHYETGIGERRVVALADGSTLSLDADSRITVHFGSERRDLDLERGRASFKVAKDPLRPFAVRSGAHMVVATGTAFSVERLAGEMRVTLYEGHVAVLRDAPAGHAVQLARSGRVTRPAEQALTPGHALILPNDQPVGLLRTAEIDSGWEAGQLSFAGERLDVAAERVNRYSPTLRIEVDPAVAAIRVSGVFNAGDAGAFARGVSAIFAVRAVLTDGTIRLVGKAVTEPDVSAQNRT